MRLANRKVNYHYTSKCDMNCNFCFRFHYKYREQEIVKTFHELCKKVSYINLVGGEVFLDIDLLLELTRIARDERVSLSLVTNGYILSEKLNDARILEILDYICVLGISVDSFNPLYNLMIGRNVHKQVLSKNRLSKVIKVARAHHCSIKINTVVTKYNAEENLKNTLSMLDIDKWKHFKVTLYDESLNYLDVSEKAFKEFTEHNELFCVSSERESELMYTYLNVIPSGDFIINSGDLIPMSNIYKETALIEQDIAKSKYNDEGYQSRYTKKNNESHSFQTK